MHSQKLNDLAVSEGGFVFDPYTGNTFNVNATGLEVLNGLKRRMGREELIVHLQELFEVGPGDDLHRDLDEFVQLLCRDGILPSDFVL